MFKDDAQFGHGDGSTLLQTLALWVALQLKKSADWGYKTVPLPAMDGREMPYTRGRVVGGCSTVNGMVYIRGNPANYDRWEQTHGCEGWGWSDMKRRFLATEGHADGASDFHGGEGPLRVSKQQHVSPVSRAWNEAAAAVTGAPLDVDFNGASQYGVGLYQQTAFNRRRCSASVAFLHPALKSRQNITLETGALVERIVIEGGRAVGVRYQRDGQTHTVRVRREVILSAGAIGSPQILMLSGIGPADHLRKTGVEVVLDWATGDEGVIWAIGDSFAGVALYVMAGRLVLVYRRGVEVEQAIDAPLEPGPQQVVLRHAATGQRRGSGELWIGARRLEAQLDMTPTLVRLGGEGMDVGLDRRRKVSTRYASRGAFRYPNRIAFVRVEPGTLAPGSVANRPELQAQAD